MAEHRKQLDEYKKQADERKKRHDPSKIDFRNPTPAQIEDAKSHGAPCDDHVSVSVTNNPTTAQIQDATSHGAPPRAYSGGGTRRRNVGPLCESQPTVVTLPVTHDWQASICSIRWSWPSCSGCRTNTMRKTTTTTRPPKAAEVASARGGRGVL